MELVEPASFVSLSNHRLPDVPGQRRGAHTHTHYCTHTHTHTHTLVNTIKNDKSPHSTHTQLSIATFNSTHTHTLSLPLSLSLLDFLFCRLPYIFGPHTRTHTPHTHSYTHRHTQAH